MIPTDVLGRVLFLRVEDSTATGFVIDVDGKQYLVTARHFAEAVCAQSPLLILFEDNDASIEHNTGVIVTYGIKHALDIIRSNSIGVSIAG